MPGQSIGHGSTCGPPAASWARHGENRPVTPGGGRDEHSTAHDELFALWTICGQFMALAGQLFATIRNYGKTENMDGIQRFMLYFIWV